MNSNVSIVIVARNEEAKIAECLTAAYEAVAEIGGAEMIVADSASTDKTAEIALKMGAKILRLKPDWELSASAGRHIGTHYAKGEFILFIDADTLVYEGFLSKAVAAFQKDEKLAGVCGFLDDSNEGSDELLTFEDRFDVVTDIKWMRGGCCFYRREAILDVGSFNPYLLAEEEADIGLRLTRKGWKLQMLPVPMAVHTRCTEELSGKSIFTHLSRSLFAGRFGGTTRTVGYAFKNGYGFEFCKLRMPTAISFAIWLFLIVAVLLIPKPLIAYTSAFYVFFLGFVIIRIKKGSVKKTLYFFFTKLIYFINLVIGIPKLKFTPTKNYPLDVEILESKNAESFYKNETADFPIYQPTNNPPLEAF
ncbi:MAG TPA: glycosyltransferase family A protein [Pyrinomonadaceae bacterium]|nr:glycosyltransferase family A protein [Pyrinomonadaceae bacterium]